MYIWFSLVWYSMDDTIFFEVLEDLFSFYKPQLYDIVQHIHF